MFPDYREVKFDSPTEFRRRMRHVITRLNEAPTHDTPDHRGPEDERCSCTGLEFECCSYCKRQRNVIPF